MLLFQYLLIHQRQWILPIWTEFIKIQLFSNEISDFFHDFHV